MGDARKEFIRKWFKRGQEEEDPFDRFFCLWIALVAAAQKLRTDYGISKSEDSDRAKIQDYFEKRKEQIIQVMKGNESLMGSLARRKGTGYGNPIIDAKGPSRAVFRRLSEHYQGRMRLTEDQLVEALAQVLIKIRNNLFHGEKLYDDEKDRQLLEMVNPMLAQILSSCEDQ